MTLSRGPSNESTIPTPENAGALTIDIIDSTSRLSKADLAWLRTNAAAAGAFLALSGSLAARIVADAEMAGAHAEFCGVEGTTDVITFDLTDPEDDAAPGERKVIDGDLLICLDEAERQAATRGHPPRRELLLYILHGILHCIGFNDHEDGDYTRMHAEEDRILTALGIGATFAAVPANPSAVPSIRSSQKGGGT